MNDEPRVADENATQTRRLSRRTVLRAAGHAAWVVPAIQVVSTAPAFAATSDILQFTPAATGNWTLSGAPGQDFMVASISVKNLSTTDTTASLQLTATFPRWYVNGNNTFTVTAVTGPWSASSVEISGSGMSKKAVVVFTASAQLAAGATSVLGFRATVSRNVSERAAEGSNDNFDVVASATDHNGDSTTVMPT